MYRLPIEGSVECPHCDLLRCWCWIPSGHEPTSLAKAGTNDFSTYECKACKATWTLGESWGRLDPSGPPPDPRYAEIAVLAEPKTPPFAAVCYVDELVSADVPALTEALRVINAPEPSAKTCPTCEWAMSDCVCKPEEPKGP